MMFRWLTRRRKQNLLNEQVSAQLSASVHNICLPAPVVPTEISLCSACNCMTHTIAGTCGKCHAPKATNATDGN